MKEYQGCGLVANARHFAAVGSQRGGKIVGPTTACTVGATRACAR